MLNITTSTLKIGAHLHVQLDPQSWGDLFDTHGVRTALPNIFPAQGNVPICSNLGILQLERTLKTCSLTI